MLSSSKIWVEVCHTIWYAQVDFVQQLNPTEKNFFNVLKQYEAHLEIKGQTSL